MKECLVCGRTDGIESHHTIKGRGKRKECETTESLVDLCFEHHRGTYGVHGKYGQQLDMKLKLDLQLRYFGSGKTEEEVRKLMGGKLYLSNGVIYGA